MIKFKVTFYPDNKSVEINKDATILSAAISAGVYINSVCGGEGVCGRCKVIVKSGQVITQASGAIRPEDRQRHIYLACLTTIHSDLEVEVPAESRLDFEKLNQQETDSRLRGLYSGCEEVEQSEATLKEEGFRHEPLVEKFYLELPKPNLEDRASDLERLYKGVIKGAKLKANADVCQNILQTGLTNIKQLGELLRDSDWKVTVALGKKNETMDIVFIEPQNTAKKNFGFAFDIGTTTISGQLIDLSSGKILGTKAAYNKQASFGSDVITRIIFAKEEDGLLKLHNAVIDTMNQMVRELIQEHKIDLNDVTCLTCTGNTTMIHLLLGVDPTFIRREPYVPTANFLPTIRASEAGININPRGLLSCVPGISSYVGGDTTAGALSSGLYKQKDLAILIDIGTNGEIALGNRDFLISAAASAGPAFEGSGVSCGMRASRGAIQKVRINPKDLSVSYETIGGVKPRGICGSGYIDLIAQLLKAEAIDKSGQINITHPKRVRESDAGGEFVVAFKEEADSSSDIVITEADIENLKRSKAAIYSAAAALIKHMDFDFSAVKKIFIAGGFGTCLDIESAITIGLLPDLERGKFVFIGNSALAGARAIILSHQAKLMADEIAHKTHYLELSVDPGYMDEYMAALFFPHTDLSKFPSIKR